MFLSKKNAAYLSRPPKGKQIKQRVLPGWGDDDNETRQQFEHDYARQVFVENKNKDPLDLGLLDENPNTNTLSHQEPVKKIYYDWDELNEMNNIECEKKLVEGIVEMGGVRIKPNDNMLTQFLKESKGMQPKFIGSLLMSKLQVNYPFQVKAKALYAIEYLVKKNQIYANYFKVQSEKIKQFPEPEENVENYRKILKSTLNTIGISVKETDKQEIKMTFEDPGYNQKQPEVNDFIKNNQKTKKPQGPGSKKFISPAQMKKGNKNEPVNTNTNGTFDLLGGNSTQNNSNNFGLDDLILVDNPQNTKQQQQQNNQGITFDDLLTSNQKQPPKQEPFTFDFM